MKVGLFIPCYMDQLYPNAAMASYKLLKKCGVDVDYPLNQSCCGQPMANTGCSSETTPLAKKWVKTFKNYDAVVCPSGSCTSMVTHHYKDFIGSELEAWKELKSKVYELSEFLIDVLNITELDASFPHRVGLHQSCHGLRELRLGAGSERHVEPMSKTRACLEMVKDIELVELKRDDECCGFGGTFAVAEEDVSCSMGRDRLDDHQQAGAEVVAGGDVSCMMHMEGLSKRENRSFKFMHFAEILMGEST